MKWNDNFLKYSGENKSIIYNYLFFVAKTLKSKYPQKDIENLSIMNYILSDNKWPVDVFVTKEKHDWFLHELLNNPHLFSFVYTEVKKMINSNVIGTPDSVKKKNVKEDMFSQKIQSYIINNKDISHYYFNGLDINKLREEAFEYAKKNFLKFKCSRSILEKRYLNILKIKEILETNYNYKYNIVTLNKSNFILVEENDKFVVNCFKWGTFPVIEKSMSQHQLLLIYDDISLYVFGFLSPETAKKYSSEDFLSFDNLKNKNLTAFYGFNKNNFLL